jgi:hypothetical protein
VCELRPGCGERYAMEQQLEKASASSQAISIEVSTVGLGIPELATSPIREEILGTRWGMQSRPPLSTEFDEALPSGNKHPGQWPNLCSSMPQCVAG